MEQDKFMYESQSHDLLVLRITIGMFNLKGNFLFFPVFLLFKIIYLYY